MNQAKQDLKDFASFFTNAVSGIEALEKEVEMLRASARRQAAVHREYRLHIAKYERFFELNGLRVPSRPVTVVS